MRRQDKADRILEQLEALYPEPPIPLDHTSPFTLLVAVLLSAQTTDLRVNLVTPSLFAKAGTPEAMAKLSVEDVLDSIRTCGLAPTKAKNVKRLAEILVAEHGGEVPRTLEQLEALPGVGHKTASVVVAQCFGQPAFPVDTHIHRLAARWGLSSGKTVERTEKDLKAVFPMPTWSKVHLQIIFFGREHCTARFHDFTACPICSWAATKKRANEERRRDDVARNASKGARERARHGTKTSPHPPERACTLKEDTEWEPAIEDAYAALERADPEAALTAAARAKDVGDRSLVEARAYMELGMLQAAAGAVGRAEAELGEDDMDTVEVKSELALLGWELDAARMGFEALAATEQDGLYWERLALLADLEGDQDRAHALLLEACAFDAERPDPVRLSEAAFDAVIADAVSGLPELFRTQLDNVRIVTEPMPFVEIIDPADPSATPPDILGLFLGPTIHDLAEAPGAELPPTIYLFQRNLERSAESALHLRDEIRVTLFHEIGHLLGLDEDEVAGMGLA